MLVELSPESEYEFLRAVQFQDVTVQFGAPTEKIDRPLNTWQSVTVPDSIENPEEYVDELMKSNMFSGSWIDDGESILFMVRSADDFMVVDEPRYLDETTFSILVPDGTDEMRKGANLSSGVLLDGVLLQLPGMSGSPSWHMWKFTKAAGWTKELAVLFIKSVTEAESPVSFATKSTMTAFKVTLPISRAWTIEKTAKDKEHWLTIEASGPEEDRDDTRMSSGCVEKMVSYVERGWDGRAVPYLDGHYRDLLAANLGECHNPRLTKTSHLAVDVKLDMRNPSSVILYDDVKKGKKHGASIAGIVWAVGTEDHPKTGSTRTVFEDVEIAEISRTSYPSWTPSFTALLEKSVSKRLNVSEALVARSRVFGEETFGLTRLTKSVEEADRYACAFWDGSGTFDPERSLLRHHDETGKATKELLLKAHAEAAENDYGVHDGAVRAHLNGHFIELGLEVPNMEVTKMSPDNTEEVLGLEETTEEALQKAKEETKKPVDEMSEEELAALKEGMTEEEIAALEAQLKTKEEPAQKKAKKVSKTDLADFIIRLGDKLAKSEEVDLSGEFASLAELIEALTEAGIESVTVSEAVRSKLEFTENKLTKSTVEDLDIAFEELKAKFDLIKNVLQRSTNDDISIAISRTVTEQLGVQKSSLEDAFQEKISEVTKSFETQMEKLRAEVEEKREESEALANALIETNTAPVPKGSVGGVTRSKLDIARDSVWGRMAQETE